jgi:hypothetical protein
MPYISASWATNPTRAALFGTSTGPCRTNSFALASVREENAKSQDAKESARALTTAALLFGSTCGLGSGDTPRKRAQVLK